MKSPIPSAALEQHIAILGKTGSAKSSVARYLAEGLLDRSLPVAILTPKGDWWGLKSSADGKKPGYPVVIFGGRRADVPISAHSGAAVAELVATGNRPAIIDVSQMLVGERARFVIGFAEGLFLHNQTRRWLVVDEAHNFAPKGKLFDPQATMMLHWLNKLGAEGRGLGLNLMVISQRPQKVHNDLLESCETLIAMRTVHPRSREAIREWIDGAADPKAGAAVLSSLAGMPRGTGWVWSPEIEFGPEKVAFPMFRTYDSFKPQQLGAAQKLEGWADVDLEAVREKLAAVVKEAAENDPKALKAEIARLRAEYAQKSPVHAQAGHTTAELNAEYARGRADGHDAGRLQAYNEIADDVSDFATGAGSLSARLGALHARIVSAAQKVARPKAPASAPAPRPPRAPAPAEPNGQVGKGGLRRMLVALAQRQLGLSARQVAVRAGMSFNSGTFARYLATLRSQGWATGGSERMQITDQGLEALGNWQALPTGHALLQYWVAELGSGGLSRILREAATAHPNELTTEELARRSGMSSNSGTFARYLSHLRSLQLLEGQRGTVRASAELFD